ncbi:MAG: CRISPR-associated protein Cas5 [Candidatus Syntrophoarchaeum caldarius]|uniref:CRISPR-associated protein Cas5 n=1 Tax=Candidatus Syntropharchaeum caldarium TaxID=1838285 RepID=A0A1F2P958_9EURY|nr:MAG: CRISPR-associated protein Cas5 [Candidatus Syntrophoarchaeum caldarius]
MNKVLVFDVWGEYAHFRKYYTTTSPLSYSIPPRTAVTGFIGAILGLKKEEYLKHFTKKQAFITVGLLNPVKKVRISENLINTKDGYFIPFRKTGHQPRTQIRFEFIKDPKYRLYFYHTDDGLYARTKKLLANHKSIYTPYLGISEHIANFEFIGEMNIQKKILEDFVKVNSVIPEDPANKIEFEANMEYFSETMPIEMDFDRTVVEYRNIMFERNGQRIKAKLKEFWELDNGERILFM